MRHKNIHKCINALYKLKMWGKFQQQQGKKKINNL